MDNQQIRQIRAITYLEGIIDGEGCLTINANSHSKKFSPLVQITNTNPILIDYCIEQLKVLDLPFHISVFNRSTIKSFYKPRINITATGLKRCKKWLEKLKPIAKAKQRDIILKFIQSRLEAIDRFPAKKPYTVDEIELVNQIREYNHHGIETKLKYLDLESPKQDYWDFRLRKTKELLQKGWTQKKIASYFKVDPSSISEWLKKNKSYL